jgi:UDP-N-acetylmuramate: L-alanyl-gamma-D-glutamyl-meso-diaminopimelate ligase
MIPKSLKSIHLIGIAGTGMGAFAGLLKQAGYEVRGSDQNAYPPMSHKLADWGIPVHTPYHPKNLHPQPDLVIVGNVIRRTNEEASFVRENDWPQTSFPASFYELFLNKTHATVITGTHGKTTTSTLTAFTLWHAGKDPGFLIGGIPQDFGESFRLGAMKKETPFVVEGDEYDTAYFDKVPKFLHYKPQSLLCTSLEFDHADIYDSLEHIQDQFRQLFKSMPAQSHVVLHDDSPHLMTLANDLPPNVKVETYGEKAHWQGHHFSEDAHGIKFDVFYQGESLGCLSLQLSGQHNMLNALGAYAILKGLGLTHDEIAAGFAAFKGIKRRMEVMGQADQVTVVDDFAHHPTAVQTTLEGARRRYPNHQLWALFEPRSATTCRNIFQDDYAASFDVSDKVLLAPLGRDLPKDEALDIEQLKSDLVERSIPTEIFSSIDDLYEHTLKNVPQNTILLCMSNGSFGGIHTRLIEGLKLR